MGRRTFDFVDGPNGWNDDIGYAFDHETPSQPPIFVLTHEVPEATRLTGFTFITEGIEAAVNAARSAASNREVVIMGGAEVIDRALTAGLVDVLRVHLSPVVMGNGTKLFDLVNERILLTQSEVVVTERATHLTYHVKDSP